MIFAVVVFYFPQKISEAHFVFQGKGALLNSELKRPRLQLDFQFELWKLKNGKKMWELLIKTENFLLGI